MADIIIKEVSSQNTDLHNLIAKLDIDMLERYPAEGIFGLDFNDSKVSEVIFAVVYLDSIPVGCGGIRPLDTESVELKRFYVDKEYRNKGIASKLLLYLETIAKNKGYKSVKLETGPAQPESIGLYKKYGYVEIDLFGEYIGSEYSLCFEKEL